MKIAVILLACLATLSFQQEVYLNIPLVPRINYVPYFAAQKPPVAIDSPLIRPPARPRNALTKRSARDGADGRNDFVAQHVVDVNNEEDDFARSKKLQPEGRFLFGFPFNVFGGGYYGNQNNFNNNQGPTVFTRTTTVWTTTSNNATTAVVQFCIPNSAFASSNVGGGTVFSTGPCARRRREAALLEEFIGSVEPSEVEESVISAVPDMPAERSMVEPLLDSSKDDDVWQEPESDAPARAKRSNFFYTQMITYTSTYTSYSLVPSTFKRTINLGVSLLCLPSGWTVC